MSQFNGNVSPKPRRNNVGYKDKPNPPKFVSVRADLADDQAIASTINGQICIKYPEDSR